ncbi:hypothetical protein TPY_1985 [Sulfobacillus acidophilus TPY]|nr:hypothetical protein TPY_1985 [Sulfobacillus acidophilus TPY]
MVLPPGEPTGGGPVPYRATAGNSMASNSGVVVSPMILGPLVRVWGMTGGSFPSRGEFHGGPVFSRHEAVSQSAPVSGTRYPDPH